MNDVVIAEYLRGERAYEWKREFDSGCVTEVPHPNRWHILIASNITGTLSIQLRDQTIEAYAAQMRVKVAAVPFYTYPDIAVASCPKFEDEEMDTLLNPTLIVEILSNSTEAYDRGKKFAHYRKLESLREYVLVAQDRCHVEHFVRQEDNHWLLSETDELGGQIVLPSIDCTLALSAVYNKVTLKEDS